MNSQQPAVKAPLPGFHTVLSDMCHKTLGISAADVARSLDLAQCASDVALGDVPALQGAGKIISSHGEVVLCPVGSCCVHAHICKCLCMLMQAS